MPTGTVQTDLSNAKALLDEYTCAFVSGDEVICSTERGVKPLLEIIAKGIETHSFCAADRIVGKAAALLYAYMGIRAVFARVISVGAIAVFERNGISFSFAESTVTIINRRGDDICPMEKAVADIEEPKEALEAIKATVERLSR